jgi:hypothetical protein
MRVPMVQIRKVWMAMHYRRMPVRMNMWFTRRIVGLVRVLVVLVVHMGMLMEHLLVGMFMLMLLDKVQP